MLALMLLFFLTITASTLATITGFGLSTVLVPTMLLFYPLPQTLLIVGIIHLFNSLWKILLFHKGLQWNLILAFGIPGIVASYLGAQTMLAIHPAVLTRVLGLLLITYTLFLFIKPKAYLAPSYKSAAIGGFCSGFLSGTFGVGGGIRSAFLMLFDLPKIIYIATGSAIAICIDMIRLTTYLQRNISLSPSLWLAVACAIPLSLVGSALGRWIVLKIPQNYFRLTVAFFLLMLGLKFLIF